MLAIAHGVAAAIAPLAAAALATADDGGGGGRGAVLAGRYGAFSGALLSGQVLGSALGSALYHKVSKRAPFVAGFLACAASACIVALCWPQEALVEDSDDEDAAPPKDHLSTVVADGCRGSGCCSSRRRRAARVLLVRAFVLAHVGAAVAPVLFPAYKQRLGMTQAQFAWLLAYAAILRCAGAGLLPFVPERHLGPRRRQRVLAISYAATAVELAGALAVARVAGVFRIATLSILVGLGEPLVRAELMLEVPARDAAAAQGALAVVAIVSARARRAISLRLAVRRPRQTWPRRDPPHRRGFLRRGGAGGGLRVAGRARRPRPPAERARRSCPSSTAAGNTTACSRGPSSGRRAAGGGIVIGRSGACHIHHSVHTNAQRLVDEVADEHVARRVRHAERQRGLRERRLGRHAAGPEDGHLAVATRTRRRRSPAPPGHQSRARRGRPSAPGRRAPRGRPPSAPRRPARPRGSTAAWTQPKTAEGARRGVLHIGHVHGHVRSGLDMPRRIARVRERLLHENEQPSRKPVSSSPAQTCDASSTSSATTPSRQTR